MAPVIIKPREPQLEASNNSSSSQLPVRKRKKDEIEDPGNGLPPQTPEPKLSKAADAMNHAKKQQESVILKTYNSSATTSAANKKARETRLEQNRKAARESRRRKKVMIEDLQRSVIFFSRANGALKHQNDELTRLLMQAQAQVSVIESTTTSATTTSVNSQLPPANPQPTTQLSSSAEVKTPVTSAAPQLPAPATYPPVPVMQPGATMQAMASFQQAAAAAMQVAVQGMQGISPGASLNSLAQPAAATGSSSAQQAYNDTMTALAMQQAAIAAAAVQQQPQLIAAQIVGNGTGWTAPAAILPATTTSAPPSNAPAAPVPVAPMPSQVAIATQGTGESS